MQEQRSRPTNESSGLRGARHVEVVAVLPLRVLAGEQADRVDDTEHVPTRRHQVRLHEAFEGRAGGRERGQEVVGHVMDGRTVRHRTHRDDVGHVAGHSDRHRLRAAVAGGGNHHQTRVPKGHHGLIQGVVPSSATAEFR